MNSSWPGYVRELGNARERAAILATGDVIQAGYIRTAHALPRSSGDGNLGSAALAAPNAGDGAGAAIQEVEWDLIRRVLTEVGGHRRHKAARLGTWERALYDKLKQ